MNEIMSLMNRDISGWMCSGDDEAVTAIVFKNLLYKAAEQHFVQVVIASEDMLPAVSQIVESDSRNKGYLPSYAHRYFPAFSGSDVDMKERMVEILKRCRVDQEKADDVMAYIDFLTELESEIGEAHHTSDEALLQKYLRASAVERALNTAVVNGEMTQDECRDWFEDYSDCSSGRIHLKRILNRLDRSFSLKKDRSKSISTLGQGDRLCFIIKSDMSEEMKELLFEMIGWDILEAKRSGKQVSLMVLEGCKKYGNELLRLLNVSSSDINFNFFAKDYFSGHTADWSEQIDEYFRRYIYTAHSRMESCEEISSKRFGQIPVVRNSYACDRDRRISNNRVLDRLLDTNRVDHYVQHVPVWEAQYRKEEIHDMQKGICLVQADTFEGYVDLRR
ncbi:hypothetical protein [Blautia fusiformis]|uniref:hypothetical protein n=1 Tax=Blautia fusiformis TaxID=2881264 RepID=UPI003D957DC8